VREECALLFAEKVGNLFEGKAMRQSGIILSAWLVLAGAALAQMEAPKPGPEHKKLDIFAGSWTLEGELKSSSGGSGGKFIENEKCEWMDGEFFVVCHVDIKSSMGNGTGLGVMGYSADDKTYNYREFNSWGESMDSKGSINGDTWTWTNDEKRGTAIIKGRFTMNVTSSTSYTFAYETSQDGTKWTTEMDGKASKSK
jgi:hypothetical protein